MAADTKNGMVPAGDIPLGIDRNVVVAPDYGFSALIAVFDAIWADAAAFFALNLMVAAHQLPARLAIQGVFIAYGAMAD
jgi:hypothetical protein